MKFDPGWRHSHSRKNIFCLLYFLFSFFPLGYKMVIIFSIAPHKLTIHGTCTSILNDTDHRIVRSGNACMIHQPSPRTRAALIAAVIDDGTDELRGKLLECMRPSPAKQHLYSTAGYRDRSSSFGDTVGLAVALRFGRDARRSNDLPTHRRRFVPVSILIGRNKERSRTYMRPWLEHTAT